MHTVSRTKKKTIEKYGFEVIGPVLLNYVEWIIESALNKGIKKIYFLARDGYTLQKIAKLICKKRNISIECRYLYCSRYSLRTASYHLLSREEILRITGMNCMCCTPDIMLERCNFSREQIGILKDRIGDIPYNDKMNEHESKLFIKKIDKDKLFWEYLYERSRESYFQAIRYFEEEKLFDDSVVLVDSGWSGSMQRSLRQLLESKNFLYTIEGYYFGMYDPPPSTEDGIYNTFYFNAKGNIFDKAWFNNNLFECMLAAPHGMTMGYAEIDGVVKPLMKERRTEIELSMVEAQVKGIIDFVESCLSKPAVFCTHAERKQKCRVILRRAITTPTIKEVEALGEFTFCDDTTEQYLYPLVTLEGIKNLNTNLLPARILRKITQGRLFPHRNFFWYYGAVLGAPRWMQPFYRWNEFLGESIRLSKLR